MALSTVAQFAAELGLPTTLLIEQLKSAGVNKTSADDFLAEGDKAALLEYLRKEHGASDTPKNKITLTRKQNTEIKKLDRSGKARTIQVEVRKKRVLERSEDTFDATKEAAAYTPEDVLAVEPVEQPELAPAVVVEPEPVVEVAPVQVEVPVEAAPVVVEPPVVKEAAPAPAPSTTIKKPVISVEEIALRNGIELTLSHWRF